MQISNTLLLDIYYSAQHASSRDFSIHALNEFRKIVHFDSAAIVDFSKTPESLISINGIHLHDAPKEKLVERPKIFGSEKLNANGRLSSGDFVLSKALSQRNQSVAADLTSISDQTIANYCRKYDTWHSLTFVSNTSANGLIPTIAFWRASKSGSYSAKHQYLANIALPHLLQAREINRRLIPHSSPDTTTSAMALATEDGCLDFVSPQTLRLLQLEWPQWTPPLLPGTLLNTIKQTKSLSFRGRRIDVRANIQGNMLCLMIRARSPYASLTEAERRIAKCAALGMQYKEIGKQFDISPATVRNQLHAVYKKLGVANKTALAVALRSTGFSPEDQERF
ncbi:helix-turn-helix transcriptional regulator [Noviherbaspirillum pedocola]|uniref:HTH luxR-type domain-containing protein n=1 Tax=Noviherbaspirillum pedocola TaxID=2801341 RepID=A0A934W8W4_9BURK|nr:helix-turn-helix transcriptional regulator [Noviherbaspirillum pedocola]MBK4736314.1 hypothetical protein [Noviherbaspirillum pedocola]